MNICKICGSKNIKLKGTAFVCLICGTENKAQVNLYASEFYANNKQHRIASHFLKEKKGVNIIEDSNEVDETNQLKRKGKTNDEQKEDNLTFLESDSSIKVFL